MTDEKRRSYMDSVSEAWGRVENLFAQAEEGQRRLEGRMDRLEAGQEKIMEELEGHRLEYRRLDGRLYRVEEAVVEDHEPRISALVKAQWKVVMVNGLLPMAKNIRSRKPLRLLYSRLLVSGGRLGLNAPPAS